MAWTQEQYTKLCENISQGVEEVWYADKKVKYMPLKDMLMLKNNMELELGIKKSGIKVIRTTFQTGL